MRRLWISGSALAYAALASAAQAQDAKPSAEVVVTGSRAAPRVATDSSAPISTYSAVDLGHLGLENLNQAIQLLAPTVNFAGAVNAGGAANARGPTMFGLGQDEVLVLVDGKRRAASSLINFNATIGRGEVPVDLSLIPMSAIDYVEVLEDGAAAQYGSDAIAGVINIILKKSAAGGVLSAQGGVTERGDGTNGDLSGRDSFAIGDGGSLTLSVDVRGQNPINRAAADTRAGVAGLVTNQQGEDGTADMDGAAVLELPLQQGWRVYGNTTLSQRWSANTIQFRLPNVDPAIYPNGFLPRTHLDLLDVQATGGIKGELGGWSIDLSDSIGYDRADFSDDHTANPSLGATSPTSFDAGGARYTQNLVDLDFDRHFNILAGANIAAGLEYRYEEYQLRSGAPASFEGAGAYGFPGFNPPSPVDVDRNAGSAYIDGELSLLPNLRIGGAARYEDYSGFSSRTTGKLSLFYRPSRVIAFRGTASTGFRAPALQQTSFATVTSQNNGGVLQNVGTFAANDPVAVALGARPIKPETSTNLSAGVVITPAPNLTVTADVFRIDIYNRIALSETLGDPLVTSILTAHGITDAASARFFTNAANTKTSGVDLMGDWRHAFAGYGLLKLNLGYEIADQQITALRTNPVIAAPDPANILLNVGSIDFLTRAQPSNKLDGAVTWSFSRYDLSLDVTRFGSFRYVPSTAPANHDQQFGPAMVVNLTADAHLTPRLTLSGGVLNLTDAYSDKVSAAFQGGTGLQYPEAGGLDFMGRQYYARLTLSF